MRGEPTSTFLAARHAWLYRLRTDPSLLNDVINTFVENDGWTLERGANV
jgi:hypothetical protein